MAGMSPHPNQVRCGVCGGDEMEDGDDGFFYCCICGSRAEDIFDTGVADEDFVDKTGGLSHGGGALYLNSHKRKTHSNLHPTPLSFHIKSEEPVYDAVGPTEPVDFGTPWKGAVAREEDYCKVIRRRYIVGLQTMVQLQCEALVEKFKVNPMICGIAASVWLRFVAYTRVYDDGWADQTVLESESQGDKRVEGRKKYHGEPRNIYNERMVIVWYSSLKKVIPLSCSLAVCYLACHVAREPILPTDIVKWIIEGKLPYFNTYSTVEKLMEKLDNSIKKVRIVVQMPDRPTMDGTVSIDRPSIACPLTASYMFRPSQAVSEQKLESMAASIAESLGLSLPQVNFFAIASRYLKLLRLPLGKILPYACRIYVWSMPPELWLSANEQRVPTRVCVMSILVVAIRIIYNINGDGKWEKSLFPLDGSSSMDYHAVSSDATCELNTEDDAKEGSTYLDEELEESLHAVHKFESDAAELLQNLEKRYHELKDRYEYSKDLPTYLEYCREVIFAGSCEDSEKDADLVEKLWDYYQKNLERDETSRKLDECGPKQKRSRDADELLDTIMEEAYEHNKEETCSASADGGFPFRNGSPTGDDTPQISQANQIPAATDQAGEANEKHRDVAIRHLKTDMEEHRFTYIPPREKKFNRHCYLTYVRKKSDGYLTYAAHADYYIILRACARAAHVDVRVLHIGLLTLERRLGWIERKIDHCVQRIRLIESDASDSDAASDQSDYLSTQKNL